MKRTPLSTRCRRTSTGCTTTTTPTSTLSVRIIRSHGQRHSKRSSMSRRHREHRRRSGRDSGRAGISHLPTDLRRAHCTGRRVLGWPTPWRLLSHTNASTSFLCPSFETLDLCENTLTPRARADCILRFLDARADRNARIPSLALTHWAFCESGMEVSMVKARLEERVRLIINTSKCASDRLPWTASGEVDRAETGLRSAPRRRFCRNVGIIQ
ncbi:hypothetical protein OH76DRAFT_308615 [Lentinus brumalis]|uniref:Uncharacterized protein n=1 Tax=Lentinus brumalis TaxID=2498619 RepID=A0A371CKB5_9APHY|nr:hypothetical protein OH76DRAFT_308615 [Polyporus brumalis]